MPEPVTMLGIAVSAEKLQTPPSTSDLPEDRDAGVPWRVRWSSAGVGLLGGLFLGSVLLTFALLLDGFWWPLACAVPLGGAAYAAIRRTNGLDVRWVLAVMTLTLVVVAVLPLPGQRFGSSLLVGIGAVVVAGLAGKAWLLLGAVRKDVLEWNAAYERLAQDARRATAHRLSVQVEPQGDRRRFVGEVTYSDASGQERTVPLVSAAHAQVQFPQETMISDASAAVVWHTPEHDVVHVVVLRDPV